MKKTTTCNFPPAPALRCSLAMSAATLLSLAALHVLSPEFDPSWRVVSEYALGDYGWVLAIMFLSWAVSSWTLAYAIRSQVKTLAGRIGLVVLLVSGTGEALAAPFDVSFPRLHGLAGLLGVPTLPVAAMLISVSPGAVSLFQVLMAQHAEVKGVDLSTLDFSRSSAARTITNSRISLTSTIVDPFSSAIYTNQPTLTSP
jgi:hypothetical protein